MTSTPEKGNAGRYGDSNIMKNSQQKEMKFGVFLQNQTPPATYASVKEAIIHHFSKLKQHDIAESLEDMTTKQIVKPIRVISDKSKEDEKQAGLDMDYKGELDDYRRRSRHNLEAVCLMQQQ
jgi:hypothetical protein